MRYANALIPYGRRGASVKKEGQMSDNREKKIFHGYVVPPDPNAKPEDKPTPLNPDGTLKPGVGRYTLTLEPRPEPVTP
jgi:hypothetical protein